LLLLAESCFRNAVLKVVLMFPEAFSTADSGSKELRLGRIVGMAGSPESTRRARVLLTPWGTQIVWVLG